MRGAPTVIRTQDQVFRLEGTLDTQYDTWRGLLRDIYLIETGAVAVTRIPCDLPAGVGVYLAQELEGSGATDRRATRGCLL